MATQAALIKNLSDLPEANRSGWFIGHGLSCWRSANRCQADIGKPALGEGLEVVDAKRLLEGGLPGEPPVHEHQEALERRKEPTALTVDQEVHDRPRLGVVQGAAALVDVGLPVVGVEAEETV